MEIIQAAIIPAAELLGWKDRIGSREVGKLGDVIAVPGDSLKDVTALERAKLTRKKAL